MWCSHILCFSAGLDPDDDSSDDPNFSGDELEDFVDDDLEDRIPDDELEGLQEDLLQDPDEMPASRRKRTPTKKKAATKDDADVEALASQTAAMDIAKKPVWFSPAFSFPYKIYMFSLQDHTKRQMNIDIIGPSLPSSFIRHAKVLKGGNTFELSIGCPRWFFEKVHIEKRLGTTYNAQHSAVENHSNNVVQPVRAMYPDSDPWVIGPPTLIPLPHPCKEGHVNWERSTWRTKGNGMISLPPPLVLRQY